MSVFDPDRASLILLDALAIGDKAAAEKWNVSERTVSNHRGRLESDPHFAALFRERLKKTEGDWKHVRLRFLRKSIAKLETLVESATGPDHIGDVAQAVKVIGELQIASDALNVDPSDQQGEQSAQDATGSDAGASERGHAVH